VLRVLLVVPLCCVLGDAMVLVAVLLRYNPLMFAERTV
jgi:hypothetical protein